MSCLEKLLYRYLLLYVSKNITSLKSVQMNSFGTCWVVLRGVCQTKKALGTTVLHTHTQTFHNLPSLWDENLTSPPCWLFRMWEKWAYFQFDLCAFLRLSRWVWNCNGCQESWKFLKSYLTLSYNDSNVNADREMHINVWQVVLFSCYLINCHINILGSLQLNNTWRRFQHTLCLKTSQ